MTLKELVQKHPELDLTAFTGQLGGGGEIDLAQALQKMGAYARYKSDHGLEQTISVGFSSEELIKWLLKHRQAMNEVRVFFGLDDQGYFTTIFFPYRTGSLAIDGDIDITAAGSAYNIGSRHPIS